MDGSSHGYPNGGPQAPALSVVIAVVEGKEPLRSCLESLLPQIARADAEVIVPLDSWIAEVEGLAAEFPGVRFHRIPDAGDGSAGRPGKETHRVYDRRRAVGLGLARGAVVALITDLAIPAPDWCDRVRRVHDELPYAVVGGAIENGTDHPTAWALHYSLFGSYARVRPRGRASYVSDVNVSYKRRALEAVAATWQDGYDETTTHWALESRGEVLFFDPKLVVLMRRPTLTLVGALRKRIVVGRDFAATRRAAMRPWRSAAYALSTPALPAVLLVRLLREMARDGWSLSGMARVVPPALALSVGCAVGELAGAVAGFAGRPPRSRRVRSPLSVWPGHT